MITFYAMLHRMRYINRWSLMRNTEAENLQEHSLDVAVLAHALALLRREKFSEGRVCPSPDYCALLAIFHDAPEILTGDLPTPIKYANNELKQAFSKVEDEAIERLLALLPLELRESYRGVLDPGESDEETKEAHRLVLAADRMSAYIKCLDELKAGNREFATALKATEDRLNDYNDLPEFRYFMAEMMPAFSLNLDELQEGKATDRCS